MTSYKLKKVSDVKSLAVVASQIIASHIALALDEKERAQISLSGGSTPYETYKLLAKEHLPWDRVDLFLGDERWVDPGHESSNALMLSRTLLSSGPGANSRFHPVPTVKFPSPEESADAFSDLLSEICPGEPPVFDLILLGLGDDGHTASLFPQSESLLVKDRWVTVGYGKGLERISLTAPVLSAARQVIFLVSGESKQNALKRLLDPSESFLRTPARLVQPNSEVLILADESAAAFV